MLRPITDTPDTTQSRTLNDYCSSTVKDIPEILAKDGLTTEVLQSIVDEYLARRIEPEVLMWTELGTEATAWETDVFRLYVQGIRLINELDNDGSEVVTVYHVHITEEEEARGTPFSDFDDRWCISIKEECSRDVDLFSFAIECESYEVEPLPHGERIALTVTFADDEWHETRRKYRYWSSFTDFRFTYREA